ncbi:MAG: 50S ribosomal protein L24 [Holosporales bacterium]|jgi:large subunit ribosomal protein L24|nr:50S ribosomal protein L24 [Holosporales bacterium]
MTQARFKIKRGDQVKVMVGRHKGRTGVVKSVLLDEGKVVVEGVNTVVRFCRPSQAAPEGHVKKTLPIHVSNVAVIDPATGNFGKVGYRVRKDGVRERFFKKTGVAVERHFK